MNQVTEEKKESVTKTFAIVGFVAIILFMVWLAVQIVSIIPNAFSSLASIADGVYGGQNNKELVVTTKNTVVNAGEAFTISWSEFRGEGAYSFAYACTEGVSVDLRKGSGGIISVPCDTQISLDKSTSVDVLVYSEKQRFTDVKYTITYTADLVRDPIVTEKVVTIVNVTIPTSAELPEEEEEVTVEETPEGEVAGETTDTPTTPTNPGVVAGEPTTIEEIIYQIPVSDPNGKIDLQITHLAVGTMSGKTFTPTATIDQDKKGAIQFEIKNIGTKTATDWSYEANLPSDITYTSGAQKALKPNEKAIITLGFEGITRAGTEKFGAEVTAKGDVKTSNNSYTWSVKVVE